jgi:hypothetical protein
MKTNITRTTDDDWFSLEAYFRQLAGEWARAQANFDKFVSTPFEKRYANLAESANSATDFAQQWKLAIGPGDGMGIADELKAESAHFPNKRQLIEHAMRWARKEILLSKQFLLSRRKELYDELNYGHNIEQDWDRFTDERMPKNQRLVIDHAFYAIYVAWRPDSKIIVPDHRPQLLRALAFDYSLIRVISPRQFEELVAYLYECLGCRIELTNQTRDFGADLLAWQSGPLSSETLIAVQVKRYNQQHRVGIKGLYELHGAISHYHAHTGHVVTTSDYTTPAREFAKANQYHLVNLERFQEEILRIFK